MDDAFDVCCVSREWSGNFAEAGSGHLPEPTPPELATSKTSEMLA